MLINVFYLMILLVLHSLALLAEVPMVQSALELSAVKQRAKGVKNIIFGKLMAIGTPGKLIL